MIHAILHYFETGNGYQFWSGFGSDLSEILAPVVVLGGLYRHHNCHHPGCWKPGHRHPVHGWPSCRSHWGEQPDHLKGKEN